MKMERLEEGLNDITNNVLPARARPLGSGCACSLARWTSVATSGLLLANVLLLTVPETPSLPAASMLLLFQCSLEIARLTWYIGMDNPANRKPARVPPGSLCSVQLARRQRL